MRTIDLAQFSYLQKWENHILSMQVLWKSALLLCCAGPGRTQRSSSGESLVPHLQGADCQSGGGLTVRGLNVRKGSDEGILCSGFLLGTWLEPKVRIQPHPFWVCRGGQWDRVFKIMTTSDLTGPEFAAYMHCDSAPSSISGTSLFVLGTLLWANLSPNSHPNARQRGQWNHSFLVLVNRYLLAL